MRPLAIVGGFSGVSRLEHGAWFCDETGQAKERGPFFFILSRLGEDLRDIVLRLNAIRQKRAYPVLLFNLKGY